MFRHVPACSGMFHVPDFIDARTYKMFLCEIPGKADDSTRAGIDSNSLTGCHSITNTFFLTVSKVFIWREIVFAIGNQCRDACCI